MDVEPAVADGVMEVIELKFATAENIRVLLQNIITQGLYKPGASATLSAAAAAREKITLAAEPRLNLLLVSASKENLAIVRQLVATLDDNKLQQGDIKIYQIKNADLTELTSKLMDFFNRKRTAEQAVNPSATTATMPLVAVADARTRTLLVAGGKEHFDYVEKTIAILDGPGAAGNEFRWFVLEHATATVIQSKLQELFTQRRQTGQSTEAVVILPDAANKSLLISANPTDMSYAETLVKLLDTKADPDATKFFPLVYANATLVAQTLREHYNTTAANAIVITAEARTNSILVTAGAADTELIGEMIRHLDRQTDTRMLDVRTFKLAYADVAELVATLNSALNSSPPVAPGANPNWAAVLRFVSSQEGKDLVVSAQQERVLLTPDRRTNILVASAPVENMALLELIVKALDTASPTTVEIKYFPLKNASARQAAQTLTELFRLDDANKNIQFMMPGMMLQNGVMTPITPTPVPGADGIAVDGAAGTAGEQPFLAVSADTRSNTLFVTGTKAYLAMATEVVEFLDSRIAQERTMKVYYMRNKQAGDIEAALRNFLDRERESLIRTMGQDNVGATERLLEREVAVVAVENSNALLVSASPQYFEIIADMILALDTAPPQVVIDVLLAEVTLDNSVDLGLQWTHMGTISGYAAQGGTNFGMSATAGGFSLSASGEHLNLFLRALQSQGRVEVLSRPTVTATDNIEASIEVVQEVPYVKNVSFVGTGGDIPQTTIDWQKVGVELNLLPRINHEGQVTLDVMPKVSSLSSSNVQVGGGISLPIINSRTARTTVTVQDSHTIVLGGLITTTDEKRQEKVPFFGDIPVLGWLFKHQKTVKQRTELLIILTPHVVKTPAEVDRVTNERIEQIDLLRKLRQGTTRSGDAELVPAGTPAAQDDSQTDAECVRIAS